ESHSKHPLAKAILQRAKYDDLKLEEVHDFKSITGAGLKGRINGNLFHVGNKSLFENSIFLSDHKSLDENILEIKGEYEKKGKTTIMVGNETEIIGLIVLVDRVRDDARKTVEYLKDNG